MIFSSQQKTKQVNQGFTLITTMLLMLVIAMLALGMLSLSTIELRKSTGTQSLTRARDNARMALMIAIGKLQQHMGPDQRVSADARVTHGVNANPAHPHWLSVWSTTRENGTAWMTRDAGRGGLQDRRVSTNWQAPANRIACLVSGNETGIVHSDDLAGDPSLMATLLGKGSLGANASDQDIVMAPKVSIGANGNQGSYSWWVSDLGAKANVATRDRSIKRDSRHGEMLSQDQSLLAFSKREAGDEERERFSTDSQIELIESELAAGHPHHMTVWSAAMPINVREGGWKRDLTAYLDSNGTISGTRIGGADLLGVADSDNLVGPPNARADAASPSPRQALRYDKISPNFGLLRTWAQRAQRRARRWRRRSRSSRCSWRSSASSRWAIPGPSAPLSESA
jgi:type II secretory pathway pseudopilin PulG